jgi:hypothetical protein
VAWQSSVDGNTQFYFVREAAASSPSKLNTFLFRLKRTHGLTAFFSFLQHIFNLSVRIEELKCVRMSAIPKGMWHVTSLFLTITPFLLAPYWASFCHSESYPRRFLGEFNFDSDVFNLNTLPPASASDEVASLYGCYSSYFLAVLSAMCMHTLRDVLRAMADPFGGQDDDDVKWDVWRNEIDRECMPAALSP